MGELIPTGPDASGFTAKVQHEGRAIEISIDPDSEPVEQCIDLAARVASALGTLDRLAKDKASANLVEVYNSGWNEFDEVQDDGSLKTVINPKLSVAEFRERLALQAINVVGTRMVDLFYGDNDLFWGHSILVSSSAGVDFEHARVELVG